MHGIEARTRKEKHSQQRYGIYMKFGVEQLSYRY